MRRGGVAAACLAAALSAAQAQAAIEVSHSLPPLRFTLRDDDNHLLKEGDLHGHTVLLYFGYSGCGESCPLTLTRLTRLARGLDPSGRDLRILFVSVTPRSDPPRILRAYLGGYGSPALTGLTDPRAEALARRLRAAWPVLSGMAPVHSTSVYIFDAKGRARFLLPQTDSDAQWRAAVREAMQDQ
jgi:protein SCO1/2